MTSYVFAPTSDNQQVSWDDPTIWSGGMVPDGTDAVVTLPAIAQSPTSPGAYLIGIASGEAFQAASVAVQDQALTIAGTLTVGGAVVLGTGGQVALEGGELDTGGGTTIGLDGEISGDGTITGPVDAEGNINVLPLGAGTAGLVISGPVTGTGTLALGAGGPPQSGGYTLELGGSDSAGVTFGAAGGTLLLDDPEQFTGTITPGVAQSGSGFGFDGSTPPIDQVVLGGLSVDDVTTATYQQGESGGLLTIVADGTTVTLPIAGDYNVSNLSYSAGPSLRNGDPSILLQIAPGIAAPTIGLALQDGGSASLGITNTGTPLVTGTTPTELSLQLLADGSTPEGVNAGRDGGTTYTTTLLTPLAPGDHEIVAEASSATTDIYSAPLDLVVLPDPVDGITTVPLSSYEFAYLQGLGAGTQFVAGTEAIALTDGTLSIGPDTGAALVQRLYEGLLGRGGDTGGLETFVAQLGTQGAASVATAILGSAEFQGLHGPLAALDDTSFVTLMYGGILGRAPDPSGLAGDLGALQAGVSRSAVAVAIADSAEAKAHLAATTTNVWVPDADGALVTQLFETGLDRSPDEGGLADFTSALRNGQTMQEIAAAVANSQEFLADHAGQGAAALVTSLYADGLGRTPDPAGLQQWVGALQSGTTTATVLLDIAASPEAYGHLLRPV